MATRTSTLRCAESAKELVGAMPIDRARFGLSVGVVLCALAGSVSAHANGPSDPFGLSSNQWQAGGFVYIMPSYEGGKGHSVIGFPFVAPAGLDDAGFVQIRGIDDIRFRLFQNSGFEFGPLVGYRFSLKKTSHRS
jgi:hypothetical protein